jgi:predicted kinase
MLSTSFLSKDSSTEGCMQATTLFVVTGSPAAGKTWYARQLAAQQHAAFLDSDAASERIVQASLSAMGLDCNDRDSEFFKNTFRQPIYESLFQIAHDNLPHTSVVIAGPFTKEKMNAFWCSELEQRFKTRVEVHYIHCSESQLKKNMTNRANTRDTYKLANWDEYSKHLHLLPPAYPHILVELQYS